MNTFDELSELLQKAKMQMMISHSGQKRWDGRPYWVHPVKVVSILRQFGVRDEHILCAGYLHDVLEDTDYPSDEMCLTFGAEIVNLVQELTFKEGSDEDYINSCSRLSVKAKLIKIADIIANITDDGHKGDHFIRKRVNALKVLVNDV